MTDLDNALNRAATAPTLLVCLDFDGTMAPLQSDADTVRPHPDALAAAKVLMAQPNTTLAVLSGRHLEGLRRVLPLDAPAVLVGSHGAESTAGAPSLDDASTRYLTDIQRRLEAIAVPPAFVEVKPFQRVLHVAALAETDPARAEELLDRARHLETGGRPVMSGHNVVEFSAVDISKGSWLAAYKSGFDTTVFAGDDTTDETALRMLGPADVGIKVGNQPSVAPFRVAGVTEMAAVLTQLAAARQRFCRG